MPIPQGPQESLNALLDKVLRLYDKVLTDDGVKLHLKLAVAKEVISRGIPTLQSINIKQTTPLQVNIISPLATAMTVCGEFQPNIGPCQLQTEEVEALEF